MLFCLDIFDVVRDQKDQVLLIDFSPFGEKWSDSLAFEWPELWDDFETVDNFYCFRV